MSIQDQLKELLDDILDALMFNKSLLPALLKAHERLISITFEPAPADFPTMVRVRLVRQGTFDLTYIDSLIDPEVIQTSMFYPEPK